jgi:hypothetical protein
LFAATIGAFGQQLAVPVEVKVDAKVLDTYVGQYEDAVNFPGLVFSFIREGDKFYIRATNQDRFEMYASSPTLFIVRSFAASAEFVKDDFGRVTGIIWRQGGGENKIKRTADVPQPDTRIPFTRTEAMIPMRDGVKLFTVILTPEHPTSSSAILLERTPYGVKDTTPNSANSYPELVKDGYAFIFQDIRGRNDSEGEFLMNRPPRDKRDPKSIDESTDTYDTIEYLSRTFPE